MSSRFRIADLTRDEVGNRVPESIVIIPTAATEQHGPHLPVDTDSCLVESIVERVADTSEVSLLATPVVVFGSSHHHFPFPGVLSLRSDTFGAVVRDLIFSLVQSGARRVYLLNGHGGNDELIRLIAREGAREHNIAIGAASYWSLAWESLIQLDAHNQIGPLPGHAGSFETAMMMAVRPDSVKQELLSKIEFSAPVSQWPAGSRGIVEQPFGQLQRGNGMSDDALSASPEWGNKMLEAVVNSVIATLNDFDDQTRSMLR